MAIELYFPQGGVVRYGFREWDEHTEIIRLTAETYLPTGNYAPRVGMRDCARLVKRFNRTVQSGRLAYRVYLCRDSFAKDHYFRLLDLYVENPEDGRLRGIWIDYGASHQDGRTGLLNQRRLKMGLAGLEGQPAGIIPANRIWIVNPGLRTVLPARRLPTTLTMLRHLKGNARTQAIRKGRNTYSPKDHAKGIMKPDLAILLNRDEPPREVLTRLLLASTRIPECWHRVHSFVQLCADSGKHGFYFS